MKNNDNVEQLFKEKFEHFEADVNPRVWSHVQHGINAAPAGGVVSSAAKFTIGKIIVGTAFVAAIAGSIWYFTSSDDNKNISLSSDKKNQTEIVLKDKTENTILGTTEEDVPTLKGEETASQKPLKELSNSHLGVGSEQGAITNKTQSLTVSDDANNEKSSDVFSRDNPSSASQNADKKTPEGPTSNKDQKSQPKPQNNNPSADNTDAEPMPLAAIIANAEAGTAPLTVSFSNQGITSSLSWDFGDGTASTENTPSHTFVKPGSYIVKLFAKNSAGNASDKITIEVKSILDMIYIPNFFTPNGDGIFDFFSFDTKNLSSIDVTIFDIHGSPAYSWTTLDGKWDGKMKNGTDAAKAVYLYTIQATGTDGVIYTRKGSVTLF
ncbi:MAG: gliding motility-associated C-terminal domain-containing protein [Bacteroidetes bacterium]|nr:gliding motility-associated C-terminal domain-containing protein [Bacteroidota bacterium]